MSLALHMNKKKEGSLFFRLHAAEAEKFLSVHFLHKAFSYIPQKNDSDGGTCALFIRSSGLHQMPQIGFVGNGQVIELQNPSDPICCAGGRQSGAFAGFGDHNHADTYCRPMGKPGKTMQLFQGVA